MSLSSEQKLRLVFSPIPDYLIYEQPLTMTMVMMMMVITRMDFNYTLLLADDFGHKQAAFKLFSSVTY